MLVVKLSFEVAYTGMHRGVVIPFAFQFESRGFKSLPHFSSDNTVLFLQELCCSMPSTTISGMLAFSSGWSGSAWADNTTTPNLLSQMSSNNSYTPS